MILKMVFMSFLFIYLFGNINSFMFEVQKSQREYCFSKTIDASSQRINYHFQTMGESKENINSALRQISPVRKDIHITSNSESGQFNSGPLEPGKYKLCFYPFSTNEFSVTFTFQTSEEDGVFKDLATDTQMKKMREKLDEIEKGIIHIQNDGNNLLTRKFINFKYLNNYIRQIKILTFVKIAIVGLISLFQIYVIQKMFGDDKRMSQIKADLKNKHKNEFL